MANSHSIYAHAAPQVNEGSREIWLPIPLPVFEEAFEVSNTGRVRRTIQTRSHIPKIKTITVLDNGYCQVYLSHKKTVAKLSVHKAVMLTFVGNVPDGKEINHIDGDKTNNRLENLEYVTRQRNIAHSHEIGRGRVGELHGCAKLSNLNVIEIRDRHSNGESILDLAGKFGVTRQCVRDLISRKTWRHLP